MKLSVVIPCYNEAATIEKVIDAVLRAPFPDKEVIVNGQERSYRLLPMLEHNFPVFRYRLTQRL